MNEEKGDLRASQRPRSPEFHRKATPWPPFDIEAFARDSERRFRAAEVVEKSSTAPPPPYHPASMSPATEEPVPPAAEVLARPIEDRLAECAARVRPLQSQLTSGGISREVAANVLRLELNALEAEAQDARAHSLVAVIVALREAVEVIGGIAGFTHCVPLEVIVVEDDATVRERVALAVESLGHAVRSAKGLADLAKFARAHAPDAIFISASLMGRDAEPSFCRIVRDIAQADRARIAVFTSAPPGALSAVARETGAEHVFCASFESIEMVAAEIAPVLDDLAW
jgi:CheY-like chemotaxis protein